MLSLFLAAARSHFGSDGHRQSFTTEMSLRYLKGKAEKSIFNNNQFVDVQIVYGEF